MAQAFGRPQDPAEIMRPVTPRNGLPVRNMGGIPQTPTLSPRKPIQQPAIAAGPPGPAPQPPSAPTAANLAQRIQQGGYAGASAPTPMPVPATTPPAAPPAPAAAQPAAPVPPPAGPASTSTSSTTGSSGQTPVIANPEGGGWNLESQLQGFLKQGFGDSVSKGFIDRAKGDVFRNVQGQTRQATNAINDDAVRRGLFKSGIPAESIAGVQGQAQSAMARGLADVLNSAESQNIQGRQQASGVASNLLGMNREQSRYEQQRADAAAARAAANAPKTFLWYDPDNPDAEPVEMDESWF
jgi:hypothetical protein